MRLGTLFVVVAACGRAGFGTESGDAGPRTGLRATISAATGLAVAELDARLTFAALDPDQLYALPAQGGPPALPLETVLALPDMSGPLTLTLDAVDTRGRELSTVAMTTITVDHIQTVDVTIGSDLPATCLDGVVDAGESDVDCGGPCPLCGIGSACTGPASCASGTCATSACEPASGPPAWLPIKDMPLARIGPGVALGGDGIVYVYGGALADSTPAYTEVDAYDPTTNMWSAAPPLATASYRMAYAADSNGAVYAIGGATGGGSLLATVERFTPGMAQWTALLPLPTALGSLAGASDANGSVYAIGGTTSSGVPGEIDAFGGAWVTDTAMPTPRTNLAAARATNGTIVVVGGHDSGDSVHYATAEAFDPATNAWTELPAMNVARSDLAAATGGDGRVYAISGYDGSLPNPVVEAYRTNAPGWVGVASLSIGRDTCSATATADGRIIVFGGKMGGAAAYASAEAYGPHVALTAQTGAPGDKIIASGQNFAAMATVRVYFDAMPVELATTDANGVLAGVDVIVPALASGAHVVKLVDDRSFYAITLPFTIE
ncbi:MAG TPA: hypothetical protein VMJ10_32085 [Kofleriaceae bacterium]|nr:hypothetical protein [Kofleriaceae bacterium]